MAEETKPPVTPTPDPADTGDTLTLDQVDSFEPDNLEDTQKAFLEEHKEELSEEQREKFGITLEEAPIDPAKIKIKVRHKTAKQPIKPTTAAGASDDDEVDPEDAATIGKIVDKKTAPFIKQQQKLADENAVDTYIGANPDFKKYRAVALKYMGNPAWQNVPVKAIFSYIGSDDLMKIGARKEREAQKQAAETRSGGHTARPVPSGRSWKNTPLKDMDTAIAKAKNQG